MAETTPDYILKQGSTFPPMPFTLSRVSGLIDLTTATAVELVMKGRKGVGSVTVTGPVTVLDAPNGICEYDWAVGDTDVDDDYDCETIITWPPASATPQIERVPNTGNRLVRIEPNLE